MAADEATLTPDAVRNDVLAAADVGGLEQPEFADKASLPGAGRCSVFGEVDASGASDREAAQRTVGELKRRGWTVTGQMANDGGAGWELHRSAWTLSVLTGTGGLSDQIVMSPTEGSSRTGESAGVSFLGLDEACGSGRG
ncbi:hypothetical protein [Streptomyces sp. NPDC020996]|uniref:hypothetical protein n=1 Tax=Streptomyces sp. NPDC020996 TaxID=3154791 RepID=UPI0033C72282